MIVLTAAVQKRSLQAQEDNVIRFVEVNRKLRRAFFASSTRSRIRDRVFRVRNGFYRNYWKLSLGKAHVQGIFTAPNIWKCAFTILYAALFYADVYASAQRIEVRNPVDAPRTEEILDLPLADVLHHIHAENVDHIVAVDEKTQQRLPSQIFNAAHSPEPDQFLILVSVPARGRLRLLLKEDAQAPPATPLVFGREAPERKDDFAWENKYVTYRVYGPALQATGEIASGIDVWSKRVPNFVIESFYKRDLEGIRTHNPALSYHKDNGQGLDSYEVGPSRGCGGTAAFVNGRLFPSKNYTSLKILSSGPIRFSFEVTYAPWDAGGTEVTETKRITLDAGSRLNRIDSTYTFAGGEAMDVAAGLAVHKDAKVNELADGNLFSVWDTPQLPTAGRIATGMVAVQSPTERHHAIVAGMHALMIFPVRSGQTIHYAAGSAWSKGDMPDQQTWDRYLRTYLLAQEHPFETKWDR